MLEEGTEIQIFFVQSKCSILVNTLLGPLGYFLTLHLVCLSVILAQV